VRAGCQPPLPVRHDQGSPRDTDLDGDRAGSAQRSVFPAAQSDASIGRGGCLGRQFHGEPRSRHRGHSGVRGCGNSRAWRFRLPRKAAHSGSDGKSSGGGASRPSGFRDGLFRAICRATHATARGRGPTQTLFACHLQSRAEPELPFTGREDRLRSRASAKEWRPHYGRAGAGQVRNDLVHGTSSRIRADSAGLRRTVQGGRSYGESVCPVAGGEH